MPSSNSTSSDSENESRNKKAAAAKIAKPREDSSSDSDFVSKKKNNTSEKHTKKTSSPKGTIQSKDLASTKFSFQKMLMNSNNKFVELLKNKQSSVGTPLKTPFNKNNSPKTLKEPTFEFSPIASSTQMTVATPDFSRGAGSAKKLKVRPKETVSSSESETDHKKETEKPNKVLKKRKNSSMRILESESNEQSKTKKDRGELRSEAKSKLQKEQILESSSDSSANETTTRTPSNNKQNKIEKGQSKEVQTDSSESDSASSEKKSFTKKSSGIKNKRSEAVDYEASESSDSEDIQKEKSKTNSETSDSEESSQQKILPKAKQKRASSSDSHSSIAEKSFRKRPKSGRKSSISFSEEAPVKPPNKLKVRLEKFEEDNESISRVREQFDLLENVSADKDIFVVQIPKSLDPKSLRGSNISLNKNTRVPKESRKYDCRPSAAVQEPIVISFNTDHVHVIRPAGSIKMQRHLKSKHVPDFAELANNHVAFPSNLKERHPLFGANYEEKISLEQHIQQKLNAALESHGKQKKKKKKHKNKEQEKQSDVREEEIFKFLNQTLSTDKKETKSKQQFTSAENIIDDKSVAKIEKKKKKKKTKDESTIGLEFDVSHEQSTSEDPPEKKRKHKKRKEKYATEEVDAVACENVVFNDEDAIVTEKRKVEVPIETDSPKKKKKKHSKGQTEEDPFNLIDEMLISKSLEMVKSSKKKKKKHSRQN